MAIFSIHYIYPAILKSELHSIRLNKMFQVNNWSLTYITMVFKTSTHIFVDNGTKFRRSLRVFCSNMLLLLLLWWSRSCQNSMLISTTNNGVSCLRWIRTTCCVSTMTRNEWNLYKIKILYQRIFEMKLATSYKKIFLIIRCT